MSLRTQDLAVLVEPDLGALDRVADRAEAEVVGIVDAERARRLGQAVALDDEHAEGVEELEHVDAERRCAGDADAQPAAELLLHLGEDELVRDALLQRRAAPAPAVPARRRPACARADAECPEADRPLQAAAALDLVEHACMDLLVDARDGRQDRRVHGAERLADAGRLRHERDGRAVVRRRLVREPAEGVRERQEEEDDVAPILEVRAHANRGCDEVPVREHAGLRRPGRSRCVDERAEVVFGDLARGLVERSGVRGAVVATFGFEPRAARRSGRSLAAPAPPICTEASFSRCTSSSANAITDSEWARMYAHSGAVFVG